MKAGTVLIYHSVGSGLISGILPRLIRFFTKSNWNHVSIIGEMTDYGYIVYEAQAKGFIKSEYTFEYLQRRIDEKTIVPKDFNSKLYSVSPEAEKLLGIPYGKWNLVAILWAIITGKNNQRYSNGIKEMICSEAVSRLLFRCSKGKVNLSKEYNKPHDMITPKNVFDSKQ
jgi:hypothetical protein